MIRLARLVPSVAVAALLAGPAFFDANPVRAADNGAAAPAAGAAGAAAPAEAAPVNPELKSAAEDFFHFAMLGRYDLAKAQGEKILGMNAPPGDLLRAFEAVVDERNRRLLPTQKIDLTDQMLRWQRQADLKEVNQKLLGEFEKARKEIAVKPEWIEQQIQRLKTNERAYTLAVEELKKSGELAVPQMIGHLRDPNSADLHIPIRKAFVDLKVRVLSPLLTATEMKDPNTLPWILSALGEIGYDAAIPYLVRIAKDNTQPETVRTAATQALIRLNVTNVQGLDPAQLFYELAEKFYYEKASISPPKGATEAYIWYWTDRGLTHKTVPAATFNEDMTLRTTENVLKLDANRGDAASLWIAAGYKREAELPDGATDPFWDANHPATHFYATASGTQHLFPVLRRALDDKNSAVALKAVKSLQSIVGATNLFVGEDSPLINAMHYPDRQVRFEAAFAVAKALPQQQFAGQERVVPILAEALAQTGKPGVLIVGPSDPANKVAEVLKANYNVQMGETPAAAIANAAGLTSVDAILILNKSDDDPLISGILDGTSGNIKLERAVKIIRSQTPDASRWAPLQSNSLISLTNSDDAGLPAAIDEARKKAGGLPIDEKMATDFAVRSAQLLQRLAISRGQVLDLMAAQPALLAALDDARPEVAKAAGEAVGMLNSREAQAALATKALDEKTPDEFKVALFKDLATHAQFYRNQLDQATVDAVSKLADSSQNLEVKSAAAEALGALNLKSEQVKTLIVNQIQGPASGQAAPEAQPAPAVPAPATPATSKPATPAPAPATQPT